MQLLARFGKAPDDVVAKVPRHAPQHLAGADAAGDRRQDDKILIELTGLEIDQQLLIFIVHGPEPVLFLDPGPGRHHLELAFGRGAGGRHSRDSRSTGNIGSGRYGGILGEQRATVQQTGVQKSNRNQYCR